MPSDRQWAGQARWFRCELLEVTGLDRVAVRRSGSLQGALDPAGVLNPGVLIDPAA